MRSFSLPDNWRRSAPYLFLAAAVFAVYANVYNNAFLFDDDLLIHLNTYLRSWDTLGRLLTGSTTDGAHIVGGFYRPVQMLCYFIAFQINGLNPPLFHLLNIAFHAANACLGYRLALRLGIDPRAALFGMLLWALHPLHTEAITYMSGTADPLFVFFLLWGLNLLFRRASAETPPQLREGLLCLPLLALGLLSKETMVVFPAVATVCIYYVSAEKLKPKTYLATLPIWIVALIYLAWRVTNPDFDGPERYTQLMRMPEYGTFRTYSGSIGMRALTFLATLPAYMQLLVWPTNLHMERNFLLYDDVLAPPVLIGIAMMLAAMTEIALARGPRLQAIAWGLLWFGAAHAPNTGIAFPMNALFLEHWMYLPTIGLFLGLSQAAVLTLDRYKSYTLDCIAMGFAVAAIFALSARTFDQNLIWRDPIRFYNNIFDNGGVSSRARNNLAIAYMQSGDLPRAIAEYRQAIKEADTYAETHYNLALALVQSNRPGGMDEAIVELNRSLAIDPHFYRSYDTLSKIYELKGDKAQAASYEKKAKEALGN